MLQKEILSSINALRRRHIRTAMYGKGSNVYRSLLILVYFLLLSKSTFIQVEYEGTSSGTIFRFVLSDSKIYQSCIPFIWKETHFENLCKNTETKRLLKDSIYTSTISMLWSGHETSFLWCVFCHWVCCHLFIAYIFTERSHALGHHGKCDWKKCGIVSIYKLWRWPLKLS